MLSKIFKVRKKDSEKVYVRRKLQNNGYNKINLQGGQYDLRY